MSSDFAVCKVIKGEIEKKLNSDSNKNPIENAPLRNLIKKLQWNKAKVIYFKTC